jgi:hypothetical protein
MMIDRGSEESFTKAYGALLLLEKRQRQSETHIQVFDLGP